MILNRLLGFQTSSAVFWKASLYPATFLRIPAEFHGSYVLSRHKSELCWRQGHCTRFLQPGSGPWSLPLSTLWSWQHSPSSKTIQVLAETSFCLSESTPRLWFSICNYQGIKSFIGNNHNCSLKTLHVLVFRDGGREGQGKEEENEKLKQWFFYYFFFRTGFSDIRDCPNSLYPVVEEQPAWWWKVQSCIPL